MQQISERLMTRASILKPNVREPRMEALMERLSAKLLSWASICDDATREQALRASTMPFIYPHIALMSDCHLGKGATVGSVIPTLAAIMPAAVGVDIGCGMMAVRTQFTTTDMRERGDLASLRVAIENAIPLSAGRYNETVREDHQTASRIAELENHDGIGSAEAIAPNWRLQLGSLGSGNHFIEISLDEQDRVWAFLHSGSRGAGNRLAVNHIKAALALCRKWWIDLPDPDLAYLVEGTPEFWAYMRDLRWAQRFAYLNRAEMMDRVLDCLSEWAGEPVIAEETIACHHNYTEQETYCATCTGIQGSDSRLLARLLADSAFAKLRDSRAGYRPSVHSCGGLLLTEANADQAPAASPDGAFESSAVPRVAPMDQGPSRSRSAASGYCECASPGRTGAASSIALSMSGQDFGHLISTGTEYRRLGTVLAAALSGEVPQINCTRGHDKTKVWLSRKGAIDATKGTLGLIPGSMGTASYVVAGKGNRLALNSSPHGAGRAYGRRAAERMFTRAQLDAAMEGIEWRHTDAFLDEIPAAYKPVEQVMADAADLVEVRHTLRQIVNVKGD
jgi:RNA-splicing ligase RtcB